MDRETAVSYPFTNKNCFNSNNPYILKIKVTQMLKICLRKFSNSWPYVLYTKISRYGIKSNTSKTEL